MTQYKTILVTGTRYEHVDPTPVVDRLRLYRLDGPFTLIVGDCPTGVDAIALDWAKTRGEAYTVFTADRSRGKQGFLDRNQAMVDSRPRPDLCLAFYQAGQPNKGTAHCSWRAEEAGILTLRIFIPATAAVLGRPGPLELPVNRRIA